MSAISFLITRLALLYSNTLYSLSLLNSSFCPRNTASMPIIYLLLSCSFILASLTLLCEMAPIFCILFMCFV